MRLKYVGILIKVSYDLRLMWGGRISHFYVKNSVQGEKLLKINKPDSRFSGARIRVCILGDTGFFSLQGIKVL